MQTDQTFFRMVKLTIDVIMGRKWSSNVSRRKKNLFSQSFSTNWTRISSVQFTTTIIEMRKVISFGVKLPRHFRRTERPRERTRGHLSSRPPITFYSSNPRNLKENLTSPAVQTSPFWTALVSILPASSLWKPYPSRMVH